MAVAPAILNCVKKLYTLKTSVLAYLLLVVAIIAISACTKTNTTTNNYIPPANGQPAFAVYGITDQTFVNYFTTNGTMDLTVKYLDSAQERVTLSVSGLPGDVTIDTTWVHSGIPTFSTQLSLYDTSSTGAATPGIYPVMVIATTASGKAKEYTFNLTIKPLPSSVLGKYTNCYAYCDSTLHYTDSLYVDAAVPNKIWFTNYAGSGHAVYGLLTGPYGAITVPAQTIGGTIYTGSGNISLPHSINISISGSCALNMF